MSRSGFRKSGWTNYTRNGGNKSHTLGLICAKLSGHSVFLPFLGYLRLKIRALKSAGKGHFII